MADSISLDLRDADEAVRAAHERDRSLTRAALFRRAVAGGGTLAAGGLVISGLPSVAQGKPSKRQDAEILNFALLLEYLESTPKRCRAARCAATRGASRGSCAITSSRTSTS